LPLDVKSYPRNINMEGVPPKTTAKLAGMGVALAIFLLLAVAILYAFPRVMIRSDVMVWVAALNLSLLVGNLVYIFFY
jgi:hypothetical protein